MKKTEEELATEAARENFKYDLVEFGRDSDTPRVKQLIHTLKLVPPTGTMIVDALESFQLRVNPREVLALLEIIEQGRSYDEVPSGVKEHAEVAKEAARLMDVFAELLGVEKTPSGTPLWYRDGDTARRMSLPVEWW